MISRLVVAAALLVVSVAPQTQAGEYHGGGQSQCSDCHIMHGTKNNVQWVVTQPLLRNAGGETPLCLSCHDGSDSSAPDIVASGNSVNPTSFVATPYTSKYGSSGGFFQSDCATSLNPFGHDLFSPGSVTAPLSTSYSKDGPLVCSDCHDPHGSPNYRNLLSDPNPQRTGSTTITLGVNIHEADPVNAASPNAATAYDTFNVSFSVENNFKAWCTDCHDVLAAETPGGAPAHYMRHPSDVSFAVGDEASSQNWVSGATGEGTGFGSEIGDGSAGIPRLRFGSVSGSSSVATQNDTVFCLSCHKAHGSKHGAGMVWPYNGSGADSLSGCQQCHATGDYSQSSHGDATTGVHRLSEVPRGNCAQCHSAHGSDGQAFDFGLFTENTGASKNQLCFTSSCHSGAGSKGVYLGQTVYAASAHNTDMNSYWPGPMPPARSSSDAGNCANCHNPHGTSDEAGPIRALSIAREEDLCLGCHDSGGPAMKDIGSQLRKSRTHLVTDSFMSGRHVEGEQPVSSNFSGAMRHVECVDCHNPHKMPSGATHTPGINTASDVLKGVSRVEVQYGGAPWQPPAFTSRPSNYGTDIRYEYELCFKCHSSWAYGSAPPTAPSGGFQTDQSVEFNPNNLSYHPVVDEIKSNSYTTPTVTNGNVETMESPWNNGRHDTMYCSDCHRSETPGDPAGPHGSSNSYMLSAPAGATDNSFCLSCHKSSVYAPAFDPGGAVETGSRFDAQTTMDSGSSHYFHVVVQQIRCRECHAGSEIGSSTIRPGSAHGTNRAAGFITGTEIVSYQPGQCTPTCHGPRFYTAGLE